MINIQLEKEWVLICCASIMKRLLIVDTGNVEHTKEIIVYA